MRVEIEIDAKLPEPYAVLRVPRLTADMHTVIDLLESAGGAAHLLIAKRDGKSYFIESDRAELIRTEGGGVILYDRAARGFTVDKTLREAAQRLGNDFIQISKSAVINIRRVDHVSPSFNGTMDVIMKNGMNDYISRKFLGDFKKRLGF